MKNKFASLIRLAAAAALLASSVGCALLQLGPVTPQHRYASSAVEYLYPKNLSHTEEPGIPVLSLPLKIGIAFVPEDQSSARRCGFSPTESQFTEERKMALMKEVSAKFKKYPFIQSIQLIPTPYLTPRGSFANLEQMRSMFGVDVVVLLSYDQVQFTDQGLLSLTYLTVVGSFVIPGEKNDTQTMVDAVVYDIASRKLLFRAPGTSRIHAKAAPLNQREQLRLDGERGFQQTATNVVVKLQEELDLFKDRVKSSSEEFKFVANPGYKGCG